MVFTWPAFPSPAMSAGPEDRSTSGSPAIPGAERPVALKSLSLEEAIRVGLAQHPSIEQARFSALGAKALTKQTRGEQYPWLEASAVGASGSLRIVTTDGRTIHDTGGHGFDPGGALAKHNQNMLTGGLLLNQLITDFGYTAGRVLAGEAREEAGEKEILTRQALVILNVKQTYFNVLLQQRLVQIAEETLKRRQLIQEQIEVLYRHHLRSKVDLDLVRVEVANAQLTLVKARNDLAERFAELNHAMGLPGGEAYDLASVSFEPSPPPPLASLVEEGLLNRPELLGERDRVQARRQLLEAVKALHFGSITAVGAAGITKYGDIHDSGIPSNGFATLWGLGATARLPLFTGFKITNQIREAGHRKGEAEQDLENLENEVSLQIIRAYLAQTTNAEQVPLERDRVAFAREALALAQERYKLGLGAIIEVIRATTVLFEAEARLAEVQYVFSGSEAALAYATGRDYLRHAPPTTRREDRHP